MIGGRLTLAAFIAHMTALFSSFSTCHFDDLFLITCYKNFSGVMHNTNSAFVHIPNVRWSRTESS